MALTVHLIVHEDFSHIGPALESLTRGTHVTPLETVVTVNAGSAEQVDRLRADHPAVRLIVNPHPQGFAANHNRVLAQAQTGAVALLNDDVRVQEGALDRLVAYLDAHPQVGLVGPYLEYPDGSPQVAVYSDPSLFRMLYKISGLAALTSQRSALRALLLRLGVGRLLKVESLRTERVTRPVPVIKGAAMVVRRAAYQQVGPMDETTLAFGEEIDWCWRFRQAGWGVVHVAEATVVHYGSGQADLRLLGPLFAEDQKGMLNYALKHRPRWQAGLLRAAMVVCGLLRGLFWLPFSRSRSRTYWGAMRMALTWRPGNT